MPRSGEIGEQIFEQVEKLVAGGMNRSEAFAKISADTGRRAGTVAANYYRVARKRAGGSLRKPRTAARRTTRTRRAASTNGRRRAPAATAASGSQDIDALTASVVSSIQALADAVKSQAAEVKDLRERLDGVRRSLG
jgi:hypothetical protein